MATAKKSSTKKTAAKKKTASVKTASKKTALKKVAPKQVAASKNVSRQMVTIEKLKKFNIFTAVVNAIFAVLSVVFLSNKSAEFYLPYSVKDELASIESTVLGPAYEAVANVELRYLLAVIFGLSAIFSLLLATALRAKYEVGITNKSSLLRWVYGGVTTALMLEFATILAGVSDVVTLKLVAVLVVVTALLGWVSENQNKAGGKGYALYYLSLVTGAFAWLPLIVSLAGTSLYGAQIFGWHVYALAAILLVGFITVALNLYRSIRLGNLSGNDYLQAEGKYISTDFLVKTAVFIVVFTALFDK